MLKNPEHWPPAMGNPRIKVCGLKREEDGIAAMEAGASFLGLIFAESPRKVDTARAGELLKSWREHNPNVRAVGVFVNEPLDEVGRIVAELGLFAAQLHGSYRVEDLGKVDFHVLRAFAIRGPEDDARVADAQRLGPVLLDSFSLGKHGGTGKVFDHALAIPALRRGPTFIAGGLNPQNVYELVERLVSQEAAPYALDVSSGLEDTPGLKSRKKIVAFFEAVRQGMGSNPEIRLP